jgi:Glyoxalase-like domain
VHEQVDAEVTGGGRVRWTGVCIDCDDAERWVQVRDPAGGVGLNFQAETWYEPPTWPEEPDTRHKMLHLEIEVDDLDAAIALAVAAGGIPAPHQPVDRDQSRIRVLLDPAGHPFCLFVSGE